MWCEKNWRKRVQTVIKQLIYRSIACTLALILHMNRTHTHALPAYNKHAHACDVMYCVPPVFEWFGFMVRIFQNHLNHVACTEVDNYLKWTKYRAPIERAFETADIVVERKSVQANRVNTKNQNRTNWATKNLTMDFNAISACFVLFFIQKKAIAFGLRLPIQTKKPKRAITPLWAFITLCPSAMFSITEISIKDRIAWLHNWSSRTTHTHTHLTGVQ